MSNLETKNTRPDYCTDAMIQYLDDLRESGQINIFGAPAVLEQQFSALQREDGRYSQYNPSPKAMTVFDYWCSRF